MRAAQALRDAGLTRREIVERLGRPRGTIDGWLRDPDGSKARAWLERQRGKCSVCGRQTSRPENKFCPTCVPKGEGPPKFWTEEKVIEAIRAWVLTYGEVPRSGDWSPRPREIERVARYRRLRAGYHQNIGSGLVPNTKTVYTVFGSWRAAIEAAGFEPRPPGASDRPRPTRCKSGHEFTPENTYTDKNGYRYCRTCQRRYQHDHAMRKKAEKMGVILGEPDEIAA